MTLGRGQTKELPVITLAGLTTVADLIAYFCHHLWEFINTIQSFRICQRCSKYEGVAAFGGYIREGALMPAAVTKERLAMITGLQLVLSNHIESESEELRIAECLRGSSCELVPTSSGSIRASMPAAATGSVATAAVPGSATCLPASSHQLQPSAQ